MEKMLYWLVKWPWIAAVVVFLALTQLPLGPWYVSAWFISGAAFLAMIVARAEKSRLVEAIALRTREGRQAGPLSQQEAKVHL
jgi:membrane protein implicated in regulation of membrane protease activity